MIRGGKEKKKTEGEKKEKKWKEKKKKENHGIELSSRVSISNLLLKGID